METSPLPVRGCKTYTRRSGPLSREGSLSCHTCCDTGSRFFRSHLKDRPIQSPLTTHKGCGESILTQILTGPIQSLLTIHKGVWRYYSNEDPHGNGLKLNIFPNLWCVSFSYVPIHVLIQKLLHEMKKISCCGLQFDISIYRDVLSIILPRLL
jgi:hypothetical protein